VLNLQGFLIVRDFFDRSELEPCMQAIDQLVDDLAERLYRANKIDGFLFVYHYTMFLT